MTQSPILRMLELIRQKQLKTKSDQDSVLNSIKSATEKLEDVSGEKFSEGIVKKLAEYVTKSKAVSTIMQTEQVDNVGFPIKFNKTHLQLHMAHEWCISRGDNLLSDLNSGKLYNSLSNDIFDLPVLASPNNSSFWGNENASVSSVLLYSIAYNLNIQTPKTGAATFYPLLNKSYSLQIDIGDYPFASDNGLLLFGDYQFGGHRYFSLENHGLEQKIFGPEDCSSAVAKATGLSASQLMSFNTTSIKSSYTEANPYGYKAVTSTKDEGGIKIDEIKEGDIYVFKSHTALISGKDLHGNISTMEFNRDIDTAGQKKLGGGIYGYNLIEIASEQASIDNPIYILRKETDTLSESLNLKDFMTYIDTKYYTIYSMETSGDIDSIQGYCLSDL